MLHEKYLPQYDIIQAESIDIHASINKLYPEIENLNFERSRIISWLFKIRGIPVPESLSLKGLEKINFTKLETIAGKEIIIGLIGQFWTPTGRLKKFSPQEFISFNDTAFAKATWNFELVKINDTKTRLRTETRILCPTPDTKRKFKIYWTFIQPFSTLIRREMLRAIKRKVENYN